MPRIAILVKLVLAFPVGNAVASDRIVVLGYICDTYESARQVALEQSWKRPENMPFNCRTLFQQDFALRIAEIDQILEVIPIEDGRWIEIGRVRTFKESGYSAGIADQLLLF